MPCSQPIGTRRSTAVPDRATSGHRGRFNTGSPVAGPVVMLRQCRNHGNFRGTNCPVCNDEGKFMMSDREVNTLGRLMAGILRHFPEKFDLDMDINGWVNVDDMVDALRKRRQDLRRWLRAWHIGAIADTDDKGRYQVRGDAVRATYAHSVEIELDLPSDDIPDVLYYPSAQDQVEVLLGHGIKPGSRRHVHLSKTITSAGEAGRVHHRRPAILEVDCVRAQADGFQIFHAGTTVYLAEEVGSTYLSLVDDLDEEMAALATRWDEEE